MQNHSSTTIKDSSLSDALSERYLAYALSTIMSRSLPDVRDGLKPVHRRLLYAMYQLRLNPASGYKKCARVVGDVIGKFHPHGEVAVYDALVRLAQDFAVRYPLIDGQGNFGNIDGDNAAAMRYTESKMTPVAELLLADIQNNTVPFTMTYDGETKEPLVLPSAFPNLLANGANGIAVGMATSIPPHNIEELCDGLLGLIKKPSMEVTDLVEIIQGPDFPTGGVLVESKTSILNAYKTGKGGFRVRAKWEVETLKNGQWQIVVTEIPYQVQKGRLIEKIAELLQAKKLTLLADIQDESTEDVRLILMPKSRNVDPEILMASLFKATDLETRIPLNLNVVDPHNTPRVMSLKEALQSYLDHRHGVLIAKSKTRWEAIEKRLNILSGLLTIFVNLDRVIEIIRFSDHPEQELASEFGLNDEQVEAILNLKLRALRKLEELALQKEFDELSKEKDGLEALLNDESLQWKEIREEIKSMKSLFKKDKYLKTLNDRRTIVEEAKIITEIPIEAVIEKEPVTILCSQKGWIKMLKGHVQDVSDQKYKEGDKEWLTIRCQTTDKLLIFTNKGKFYTLGADKLPGGRGFGEPVNLMFEFQNDEEIVTMTIYNPEARYLLVSKEGRGFFVKSDHVIAQTRSGKQIMSCQENDQAFLCRECAGDHVAVIGTNRKLLIFAVHEIPQMAKGRGVILQRYRGGKISDVKGFVLSDGLTWKNGKRTYQVDDLTGWIGHRAQVGKMPPTGFPRDNTFGE